MSNKERDVTSANDRESWQIIGVLIGAAAAVLGFVFWVVSLLTQTGQ